MAIKTPSLSAKFDSSHTEGVLYNIYFNFDNISFRKVDDVPLVYGK